MKILLVIPSVMKRGREADVAADRHPTMDYYALARAIESRGAQLDFLDYAGIEHIKGMRRDFVLAVKTFLRRGGYDAIFTNGENVGLPLAMMLKADSHRPRHVTIGHRLSASKKKPFFAAFKAHRQIDKIFVYSSLQYRYGRETLGIPQEHIEHIQFHADTRFFRPMPDARVNGALVSAAGLEWRDYETLIETARILPDIKFKLAAASPWSKHTNRTQRMALPDNVTARRYEYGELRDLYASSAVVAVPLIETDFQAGITTILEAMAMAKPVIVSKTSGQNDVIIDNETGIYVPPGDAAALRVALCRVTAEPDFAARLGANARKWVEERATLDLWADRISNAILVPASEHRAA